MADSIKITDNVNLERKSWKREFVFQQITLSDIYSAFKELNVNKSPGPDHIAPF
ncbi:MAG: hypothetical protein ACRC7H_07165 [Plesiomonas shigelloides]